MPRTAPSKVPYVSDLISDRGQLFFLLTETWLKEQREAELKIEGYVLFRADRKRSRKRRGRDSGGVGIYVRNDLALEMEEVLNYSNGVVEMLGLFNRTKNMLIIGLYRQPDDITGGNRSTLSEFNAALSKLRQLLTSQGNPSPLTLLCGDFNLPHAVWPQGEAEDGCPRDERDMIAALYYLTSEFFLIQNIRRSTHKKGNILDLLFTSDSNLVHSYETVESVFSDHNIVECASTLECNIPLTRSNTPREDDDDKDQNFNKLNFFNEETMWETLNRKLRNQNWRSEFRGLSTTRMLDRFIGICYSHSVELVPRKVRSRKETSNIPRDRRNLMRKRRRVQVQLLKRCSEARLNSLKDKAIDIEKELQKSYKKSRSFNENRAIDAIKRNIKYFFSYAKSFSSMKVTVGPLIGSESQVVSCPLKMAQMLSEQYSKVFSTPLQPMRNAAEIFPDEQQSELPQLCDIHFDSDDIIAAIDEIPPSSAAGPDQFPVLLLKNCKTALAEPLYMIWRRSLDTGEIPHILKTANIIPIHKGDSRGLPANYRPVALTSHLIKLFEKVLRKWIVAYMEENNLFNPNQHGFRAGRSCLTQLIAHFDYITQQLERGLNVDVIYLDFAKAFDKVDFLITMDKLRKLGISGKIGRWIHAFLNNRTQSVIVDGMSSSPARVHSGVPQGSVLGPLLFLILIGDIDRNIKSAVVSSFADDTRAAYATRSVLEVNTLQKDLNSIYQWADENNMQFNDKKFECLRYGINKVLKESTQYIANSGNTIENAEHVRDLGVYMSSDGTFNKHVSETVIRAKSMCGWILRTFRTRDMEPMLQLWKSLVRSNIDYCCQLWNPNKVGAIQDIEQTQRSFIRKINGMQQLSYWEQLAALSLYSLERRRERHIIMCVWRILEGLAPNFNYPDAGGIQPVLSERRGRSCVVPLVSQYAPASAKNIRYSSFGVIGPKLFNIMPKEIRNLFDCSLDKFKHKLDSFLQTVPDEPLVPGYTAFRRAESNSLIYMAKHARHKANVMERPTRVTA